MKRLISLIVICALLLTLSSCGSDLENTGYLNLIEDGWNLSAYHEWTLDGSEWNSVTWNISEVESESPVYCMFIPFFTDRGYFDGTPIRDIDGELYVYPPQGDLGYVFCSKSPFSLKIEEMNYNNAFPDGTTPNDFDITNEETYEVNDITWYISPYYNKLMYLKKIQRNLLKIRKLQRYHIKKRI